MGRPLFYNVVNPTLRTKETILCHISWHTYTIVAYILSIY